MRRAARAVALVAGIGPLAFASSEPPPEAEIFGSGTVSLPGTHETPNGQAASSRFSFTRCRADFTDCEMLEAERVEAAWRVNGRSAFASPPPASGGSPAEDGSIVYYHSTPKLPGDGAASEWKIWEAVRSGAGWSRRRLPAPVNTEARECCVAALSREVFSFASDRDGVWEIFRAARLAGGWAVEKLPPEINASRSGQWPSQVGPGERFLLFSSIREGGPGGDDVYVAFRRSGSWSAPRALPAPVNSPAFEDNARVSADGRYLFWSSNRPRRSGDRSANVYRIPIGHLLDP